MKKSPLNLTLFCLALYTGVAISPSFPIPFQTPVFGQTVEGISRIKFVSLPSQPREPRQSGPGITREVISQITFEPPPGQAGTPGQAGAGGTRGKCPQDRTEPDPPLTLLIPLNKQVLTVAEHPTFFVYVPPTLAQIAQFVLKEKVSSSQSKVIYEAKFPLSGTSGIVSLRMPDTANKLEIGKHYQWSFALICDPLDRGEDKIQSSSIQRTEINANLAKELEQATPLDRANLYAKNGIWQDAIATLVELRNSQPDNTNVKVIWEELLQSEPVKLNQVAKQPLVNCCQAQN